MSKSNAPPSRGTIRAVMAAFGRRGGKRATKAQQEARRENGKSGGRPANYALERGRIVYVPTGELLHIGHPRHRAALLSLKRRGLL